MATELDVNEIHNPQSNFWEQFTIECLARGLDICETGCVVERDRSKIQDCTFTQADLDSRCAASYDGVFSLCRSLTESTDLSFSVRKVVSKLETMYSKLRRNDEALYRKVRQGKLLTHDMTRLGCLREMPTCKTIQAGVTRLQTSIVQIIENPSKSWIRSPRYLNSTEARQFVMMVKLRYSLRKSLDNELEEIKRAVYRHNALRFAKVGLVFSDDFLGTDLLEHIFEFCGLNEAVQLMRVNKVFFKNETLRGLLPQLSIRHVPGVFPHAMMSGNNYILNHKKVGVYVDFVISGSQNSNTKALSRHHVEPMLTRFPNSRTDEKLNANKVKARWAPEEIVDDNHFRKRVSHEHFFSTPIFCKIDLVSAETHECVGSFSVVSAPGAPPRRGVPGAADETYTCFLGNPHPAKCECFIQSRSQQYGLGKKQRFCIRAQGSALVKNGRMEESYHRLVAFSRPFEVVSKLSVAKNAQRRESKERDREQQKKQKMDILKR